MCRLAIFNYQIVETIEENYGIVEFLKYLERSCGGHGNGLALVDNNNKLFMKKGVYYSVDEIADKITSEKFKYGLFHTRIASVGDIKNKNCHPFYNNNGMVLAMNGTLSEIGKFGKNIYGDITDTETVLKTMTVNNTAKPESLQGLRAVFVGFYKLKPFVVRSGGDLQFINDKNGGILFASEIPFGDAITPPTEYLHTGDVVDVSGFQKPEKWDKWDKWGDMGYYGTCCTISDKEEGDIVEKFIRYYLNGEIPDDCVDKQNRIIFNKLPFELQDLYELYYDKNPGKKISMDNFIEFMEMLV